ncbi:MAG: hypothetical protein MJ066_04860 [Clostridia bacterium]|nr:hypothetical protein [Clostridia bacterium]
MKKSKLYTILIAFAFMLSLVFACLCLLTVKKVQINYTLIEETDVSDFEKLIDDRFGGKIVLFINENKIKETMSDAPYYSFVKMDKHFPNKLILDVETRRETYLLQVEENNYIIDQEGYVLSKNKERVQNTELIDLSLDGIEIESIAVGQKLSANKNDFLYCSFEMAKAINLSDNVEQLEIIASQQKNDVVMHTRTGVKVIFILFDHLAKGKDMAVKAFDSYNEKADDYSKTYNEIEVSINDSDEIKVWWIQGE